ncbi:MAG TPA: phosphatidylglycerophosphatase A [Candidatus Cybelea sp.]|nr:phosphatidylglycerophosphatase A [Candidatus Cybelea sp.]
MTDQQEPPGAARLPSESPSVIGRKPRLALFVATAGGLGYLPKAPGTWGSIGGVIVAVLPYALFKVLARTTGSGVTVSLPGRPVSPILMLQILIAAVVAMAGVWSATRAANFWGLKDPQRVVIDEVSGQQLALTFGCSVGSWSRAAQVMSAPGQHSDILLGAALNWKYLLLGFILFRVFDIWKPFPARQAESLPGGWGIMTDDWVAGVYAAIGLWIARAVGL